MSKVVTTLYGGKSDFSGSLKGKRHRSHMLSQMKLLCHSHSALSRVKKNETPNTVKVNTFKSVAGSVRLDEEKKRM